MLRKKKKSYKIKSKWFTKIVRDKCKNNILKSSECGKL